jgi:hypothetical protein
MEPKTKTHEDLMPRGLCPSMRLKHMLTHSLQDPMSTERKWPGDGYYWCTRTCNCVGPDDELVNPGACLPGRACYAGPAASPQA